MHPGVADAAEHNEVSRGVVCRVKIDVMNVEVRITAADGAYSPITVENGSPDLSPAPQPVFRPSPDREPELLAEDGAVRSGCERAPAAEPEETVPVRAAAAEGSQRAVERAEGELQIGSHAE